MIEWSLTPASRLGELAERWDHLNARCGALPFHETTFLLPLLAEFGSGDEVIAWGREAGQDLAGIILRRLGSGRWESFQPSQLPLGPVLLVAGTSLADLAESLSPRLPGFTLTLAFTQLDPLFNARPAHAPAREALDYIETAWIDIDCDFDTYWAARGKNLRQNMRKQRRKLETDGIAVQLDRITEAGQVAGALAQYGELESAGWKADGGTAIAPDNAQGRFYTAMLEGFCAKGRGFIYRYQFGSEVVAMDLCIASESTLVILKTSYDERHKTLSPAFLMREEQFAALFAERRFERIEFYGKVMDWHRRWTDNARMLYHYNHFRWSVINRLRKLRSSLRRPASAEGQQRDAA